jgi:ENTS family enterobactin (siderophore) exporter
MVGGLRYLKGHQPLEGIFLGDLIAMTLGMPGRSSQHLDSSDSTAAPEPSGSSTRHPARVRSSGRLLTGWVRRREAPRKRGDARVVGWGVAITLFGLSPWLAPALILLGAAGASDVFSAVFRGSILQLETPPAFRANAGGADRRRHRRPEVRRPRTWCGRALLGPVTAVVSGGLACIAGIAVLARALPKFTHLALDTTKREVTVAEGDERPLHLQSANEWSGSAPLISIHPATVGCTRERDQAEGVR